MSGTAWTKQTIRWGFNVFSHSLALDLKTNAKAVIWKGTPVDVQIGVLYSTTDVVAVVAGFDELYLSIVSASRSTEYIRKTVLAAAFTDITFAEWTAASKQHATVSLTEADLNITITGGTISNTQTDLLAVLWGKTKTTGLYPTLGVAGITFEEDGVGPTGLPVWSTSDLNWRIHNGKLQVYNADTGLYHSIAAAGAAGMVAPIADQTGEA
ncbi:MAG TPA: hypothetical protein P5069_11700 [Candidatus Hydrogenedentes bacterium]|nr:hypothetical protein [Candidatus Hydrogenedentota bacterium]